MAEYLVLDALLNEVIGRGTIADITARIEEVVDEANYDEDDFEVYRVEELRLTIKKTITILDTREVIDEDSQLSTSP
jgi:hypothetical protein